MNNALLYLGGLLITALAVLFAVPYMVDWNSYRGVFEEEASRILGRDVRVGGAVNLHLLPAPYIGFEKVRIADSGGEGGNSIFRVESFTMWLSVPPLLRGVIEANQVELRRPVIQLSIDQQGAGNWRSLAINADRMPFAPTDVALQSVKIVDGTLALSGPARSELAQFDAINGEFSAEAMDGPFKFKGTLNWHETERSVRLATARRDPNGDIRFKAAVDARETGNSYLLDGRVSDLSGAPRFEGQITAKISLAPAPAREHAAAGSSGAHVTAAGPAELDEAGDPGSGKLSQVPGESATQDVPVDAVEPRLNAPAADEHGRPKFDLRAKVKGDGAGMGLDDITVTLEQGGPPQLITGSARLAWAEKTRFDVQLASRWLDLDVLLGADTSTIPLEAARGFFEGLAAALPTKAETNAILDFDQLNLGGEAVSNVHLAASRTTGPLELKGLRASLPGGARLDLDGVLTPGQKAPKLDGTLAVAGQSLMRFLAWGLRNKSIGEGRTDGPFALDGRFALGDNRIELTEATAEFADTPLSGDVKLDLGERKRLALALEGTRIDAAQIKSGILGAGALQDLLQEQPSSEEDGTPQNAQPRLFDPKSADLALKLNAAEITDGERVLRDVAVEVAIERGALSLPALKFATPEGLRVEVEGHASDVHTHPYGALRGLIAAPTTEAALAFVRLLDLSEEQRPAAERLAKLAPYRLAGSIDFPRDPEDAKAVTLDGTVDGGRMRALLRLAGGRSTWRSEPIDVSATVDSPNVERLFAAAADAPALSLTAAQPRPGRVVIKAAGVPANGMPALVRVTSDGFALDYDGRVALTGTAPVGLAGNVAITAGNARTLLALAGVRLGEAAGEPALAGMVAVRTRDDALTLSAEELAIGESKVRGTVTLAEADDGQHTVTADLDVDRASLAGLMSPILAEPQPAPALPPAGAPVQSKAAPPQPVPLETAAGIWPEQPFDLRGLDGLAGKVALRVRSLAVEPGLTIGEARLAADIGPQGISIASLEGTAVGGKLASSLNFEKAAAGVGLTGSLRIDVSSKADGAAGPATPGDVAALSLEFKGRALSPAALIGDLKGKGEIALGDTTLSGMSPGAVTAVAEAALAGKGPTGGEALAQAVKAALKTGQLNLGKLAIPIEIADGAMKLGRVNVESAEGRSTFATAVELATMRIDSEWQIEPRVAKLSSPTAERVLLPAVTVVYVGKLSEVTSLEPVVTTAALERELTVRKMERDVDELERLRKLDQARAREEAERARSAAPPPEGANVPPQEPEQPHAAPPPPALHEPSAGLPEDPAGAAAPETAGGPADAGAADATTDTTVGEPLPPPPGAEAALPADAAAPRPRKKKPAANWSPFQNSPLSPF